MTPTANGNGHGRNGGITGRYLALMVALGPIAAGVATYWFNKDATQMLAEVRVQREQAISGLELRLRAQIMDQRAQWDREMIYRDNQRQDHEERLRRLEQAIYGRNPGPEGR